MLRSFLTTVLALLHQGPHSLLSLSLLPLLLRREDQLRLGVFLAGNLKSRGAAIGNLLRVCTQCVTGCAATRVVSCTRGLFLVVSESSTAGWRWGLDVGLSAAQVRTRIKSLCFCVIACFICLSRFVFLITHSPPSGYSAYLGNRRG